ncbi:MAG TPA: FAD-linked oxidase C-terminal domain-containing protein, partial [Pirellulaceae bacterium]
MDAERQRIQDDLRGRIQGDVHCDSIHTQIYSLDASIYSIPPIAVVRPRHVGDVVTCLHYAEECGLPIHPRGAGSGVSGGCLGAGIVLDFSRYMRRTLDMDDRSCRVQSGITLAQLDRQLQRIGRRFGPDPANRSVSTLGGTLAVNGSGSHWPRYGAPHGCVERLQVVLASGEILDLAEPGVATEPGDSPAALRVAELASGVEAIARDEAALVEASRPLSVVNSSGYDLFGATRDGRVDLTRLLVGSEGTLGIITEATLRTFARPKHEGVVLLFFDRLEKAARAALELRGYDVAACDLMDRRLLRLARESDRRYDALLPESAEAMLLVELDGEDSLDVRERLKQLAHIVCRRKRLAMDSRTALDVSDVQLFWRIAQHVVPTLYRISESVRAVPFVEDMAVPPDRLPEFLLSVQNVLKRHQITASIFAHATHGQLHVRPFINLNAPEEVGRLHHLARDLYREVADVRGTLSGEHGDGLCRSWHLREQSPAYYKVLLRIKQLFDPKGILNPGKVASDVPASPMAHLRKSSQQLRDEGKWGDATSGFHPETSPGPQVVLAPLELKWNHEELFNIVATCNGCGRCRTTAWDERMCPIFRILPAEEASPRAKATLLRGMFDGTISQPQLGSDELRAVSDLCVNCQQCRQECPAGVDIPKLVLECKAQHVARNGLDFTDYWLGRIDDVARWLAPLRGLANRVLRDRRARWWIERMLGIARQRKLPRLETSSFLQRAHRRQLTKHSKSTGEKVLYFTDVYANWFDVQLAEATVTVLHHNGVSVYVPPKQVQSGMAFIAA